MSRDRNIVATNRTFILAGYTVPCNGTVVAWEFCYLIGGAASVTFHPGIWRISETNNSSTHYELVQSNSITYDPSGTLDNICPCKVFNLSVADQFTAPAGSVVGLYSNLQTQLLHTNPNNSITTYPFRGNLSSITTNSESNNVNYNIAIRVHLSKYVYVSNAHTCQFTFYN